MTGRAQNTGAIWAPGGTQSIAMARASAPGIGMAPMRRWCAKCEKPKPLAGSKKRGVLFVCADCVKEGK